MRKIAAAAALIAMTGTALAQQFAIDDKTKCKIVGDVLDAPNVDRAKAVYVYAYIENVYNAADAVMMTKGRRPIMPAMSDEGRRMAIATTTVGCRDKPAVTIYAMAVKNYEALRMIATMGDGGRR